MNKNTESGYSSNLPAVPQQQDTSVAVYDPYVNQYVPDDEIDLRDILRIIKKHKWLILSTILFFVLITAIATMLMRPVYRSSALVEIKPETGSVIKLDNISESGALSYRDEYQNTQLQILQSDTVIEEVIDSLDLYNDPELNGEVKQRGVVAGIQQLASLFASDEDVESGLSGEAVEELLDEEHKERIGRINYFSNNLHIELIRRSNLYRISYDSFDAKKSSEIANSLVAQFMRLNRQRKVDSSSDAKAYLQDEIERMQAKLEASEKDLSEYARANNIVDVEDSNNIIETKLADLDKELTQVKRQLIEAESLNNLSKSGANAQTLPSVLENELIRRLKAERAEKSAEYNRLAKIYKPAYPKLQQLGAEIGELDAGINAEVGRLVGGVSLNFENLKKQEESLTIEVELQQQRLLDLRDRSTQYNILKREWESNKELYTGLLDSMKEAGVATGLEISNISVIDEGKPSIEPHSPKLIKNIGIAGAIGTFCGLSLAFLFAFFDNTVRDPEQVERLTGLPCLGVVPKHQTGKKRRSYGYTSKHQEVSDKEDVPIEFLVALQTTSDTAEAIKSLHTNIRFSQAAGVRNVLLVTSSVPSEGKTSIATNLAISMIKQGQSVALVDADFRRPRLHRVFGVEKEGGLTESLISDENPELKHVTLEDDSVVHFLANGTFAPNPSDLISSQRMDEVISYLSERHDHVILDAAPLLGLADTPLLSHHVGGLIYVVKAGATTTEALRTSVKRLRAINAPLLGIVLNDVDTKSQDYYQYQGYYSYGQEDGV